MSSEAAASALAEGIRLFNERSYFEAHEVLEEPWVVASGTQRQFLQGLIQAAVAMHHLGKGNLRGFHSVRRSCLVLLEPLGSGPAGVDTARLCRDLLAAESGGLVLIHAAAGAESGPMA